MICCSTNYSKTVFTPFDGKGSWTFNNDFARNVIIFGIVTSSSSRTCNLKNDLFDFRWRRLYINYDINVNFGAPGKILILTLVKETKKVVWVCIIIVIIVIYLQMKKEIHKFKASNKNIFPCQSSLGSISNKFDNVESKEEWFFNISF